MVLLCLFFFFSRYIFCLVIFIGIFNCYFRSIAAQLLNVWGCVSLADAWNKCVISLYAVEFTVSFVIEQTKMKITLLTYNSRDLFYNTKQTKNALAKPICSCWIFRRESSKICKEFQWKCITITHTQYQIWRLHRFVTWTGVMW